MHHRCYCQYFLLSTSQCYLKCILFSACLLVYFWSYCPLCSSKPFHFLLFCSIPPPSIPSVLFPFVTLFQTELLLNLATLQLHPFGLSPAMTRGHTSSPLVFFPFLLYLILPFTPIPGLSLSDYPGPGHARAQTGLVHPIQCDGEPQT